MSKHDGSSSSSSSSSTDLDVLHAQSSMKHPKGQEATKVLRHEHCIEAHNRNAGSLNGPQNNEGGISNVQLAVQAAQEDAGQAVDGKQVDDEGVAAPRGHLQSGR